MIEVRMITDSIAPMLARLAYVKEQLDLERRQGLEADWTAIVDALESVRDSADHSANAAWQVIGEYMNTEAQL